MLDLNNIQISIHLLMFWIHLRWLTEKKTNNYIVWFVYISEIYSPAKEGNPDVCFRSSFLRNSENEAGVTSSPALAGENSKIPAPLSRISSSEESSKDMDIAGPSSPSRSRLRRRVREGWKLNSGTWSSCPVKQSSDHLMSLTSSSTWVMGHLYCVTLFPFEINNVNEFKTYLFFSTEYNNFLSSSVF